MANSFIVNPARYGECNNNHKFAIGRTAKDGCMEFFPTQSDPYTCDACGCHRSFHKKDSPTVTREPQYEKCCKNRTLKTLDYSMTDGCLEFFPQDNGTGSVENLMCAACGCHRSFHERKVEKDEMMTASMRNRQPSPAYRDDY